MREDTPNPFVAFEQKFKQQFGKSMDASHYEMLKVYLEDGLDITVALAVLEDAEIFGAVYPKYLWIALGKMAADGILTMRDYLQHEAARAEIAAGVKQVAAASGGGYQRGNSSKRNPGRGKPSGGNKVVPIREDGITGGETGWHRG